MGKKQHQKDKLYLTCTEWSTLYGGRTAAQNLLDATADQEFRRLPFDHCSLSLQPFTHPYCNTKGVIYDLQSIVPFVQKFGIDPYDGEKIDMKCLVKLNFHKNKSGQFHCPVLFKAFSQNSHIVAIRTTGNVFSYEAVEELNLKAKNMRDLLNDEPFVKSDIIVLQDPKDIDKFNVCNFYHIKNQMRLIDEEGDSKTNLRNINNETRLTLEELSKNEEINKKEVKEANQSEKVTKVAADQFNSAHYSTGMVAAGFTSTVMEPVARLEPAVLSDDSIKYSKVKKKGYVRLVTNLGNINLELYCDQTPKTCDNFLRLCKKEYYNNVIFHRLIKNFMIQTGDPTGTGSGGESAFGKPFEDEIRPQFSHEGRGVLSMANSGANCNKSQFFITFRSCKHLDKKHTIFGRVVGGLEVLDKMERIKTNDKNRPLEEIKIIRAVIFVDPFQEIEDHINKERDKLKEEQRKEKELAEKKRPPDQLKPIRSGIGSFIDLNALKSNADHSYQSLAVKKQKTSKTNSGGRFGDFSNW